MKLAFFSGLSMFNICDNVLSWVSPIRHYITIIIALFMCYKRKSSPHSLIAKPKNSKDVKISFQISFVCSVVADAEAGEIFTCWCTSSFLNPSNITWEKLVGNIWNACIQHHLVERCRVHQFKITWVLFPFYCLNKADEFGMAWDWHKFLVEYPSFHSP